MPESLRKDAWADVYLDRGPASLLPLPTGAGRVPEVPRDGLRAAVAEAQDQARALRDVVCQTEAVLESCRDVLDALRAILTYPSAYGWEDAARRLPERTTSGVAHPSVSPSAASRPSSATPGCKAS